MDGTITLLNKLKRKDSTTNLDVWYKTIIKNCAYKQDRISNVNGSVVSMGQTFTILIPFTGKYLPYREWKKLEDKTGYYTLSEQDVIILDEVAEDVTAQNITQIKNDYEPNTCDIRSIEQVQRRLAVNFEFRVSGV
nr:MAG TPA: cyanase [Caudoviricetes sp.]